MPYWVCSNKSIPLATVAKDPEILSSHIAILFLKQYSNMACNVWLSNKCLNTEVVLFLGQSGSGTVLYIHFITVGRYVAAIHNV